MTITTDFDIGDEVRLENGEKGKVTSITIRVRSNKSGGDYKVEYEIDHSYVRLSFQLTKT
ncbi:hypothetical protein Q0590_13715 [Rhodocytophaga aerolata]|uniref:Uncharacterized protein n=1 Tax=Rhodocytophaga aerolata TaxID=455078 RepID=A0ABT8R5E9_9BACT|nr:hypothetical protein [Rhodocytophaga aerolata]MDO1447320.1 hypothetical protein [Rhodocytophaga aerolata]